MAIDAIGEQPQGEYFEEEVADGQVDETEEEEATFSDIPPEELHRLIRELPTGYRTVLNLFVFEEWSHQQIADHLGIKKDTSASQFSKAKNLLSKKIKDYQQSKRRPR